MRTLLSAVVIGIQVTMILTLVGLSDGMLGDIAERSRGVGADIMIRPGNAAILGFSGNMPEGIVKVARETPHVALAMGTLVQPIGNISTITGIHLDQFNQMSGGFQYLSGGPFTAPNDLIVDEVYARQEHAHVGDIVNLGSKWRVSGIVESGKMSRTFADIASLQDMYSASGKVTIAWVKVDQPSNIPVVMQALQQRLTDYNILSVEDYTSQLSANNIPMLRKFTAVVIGLGIVIGFLGVFLSMYTAVLERTREIGILKALGASPQYILGILLRETTVLAVAGAITGILMTYGARALLRAFAPEFTTIVAYDWWPRAALIALVGALIGAIYPGLKAARQDAIEALSYD